MPALTIGEHPHRTLQRRDTGEVAQAVNIPPGIELLPLYLSSSDHHAMDPVLSCIPSSHPRKYEDPPHTHPGIHSKDKKMSVQDASPVYLEVSVDVLGCTCFFG